MKRLLCLLFLVVLVGCNNAPPAATSGKAVTYSLRGKVISTDASTGEVTLAHEAIPGFMEAMTMPYKLKDPGTLSELHSGDHITARLNVMQDTDGEVHDPRIDQIVVTSQARPDYKPTKEYHVPQKGEAVPDFKLVNQDGRTIHLHGYAGKALLITFIYTRCPFSDFCPKMSRNFAAIEKDIRKDPALSAHTHLLSISFDPAYDNPGVLRSYGGAYTGNYTKERFQHWEFAAPSQSDLAAMEQFFNVGVTPGGNGSLNHSLSTLLLDRSGRIAAWYPGGDWKPADVEADMRHAAGTV
jgi:protein SCO1/2